MREILFRAIYRGSFVYGNLIKGKFKGVDFYEIEYSDSEDFRKYQVDEETIGQYTGLDDKDGKPVFEGDIVCLYDNEGSPMYYNIEWKPDCYMMVGDGGPGEWLSMEEFEGCIIVGNKYENPELNPR